MLNAAQPQDFAVIGSAMNLDKTKVLVNKHAEADLRRRVDARRCIGECLSWIRDPVG